MTPLARYNPPTSRRPGVPITGSTLARFRDLLDGGWDVALRTQEEQDLIACGLADEVRGLLLLTAAGEAWARLHLGEP